MKIRTILWIIVSIIAFAGCRSEHYNEDYSGSKLLLNAYSCDSDAVSRAYMEENSPFPGGLRFHWEPSVEGEEDMIVSISDGTRFCSFTNNGENVARVMMITTNTPELAQLSIMDEVESGFSVFSGNEIISYAPFDSDDDVVSGCAMNSYTMFLPEIISAHNLNSTRHLSPYAYISGRGVLNEEGDFLTSNIYYKLIPSIIRFRITNTSASDDFNPTLVRINGDISVAGTIFSYSDGTEEIKYTLGNSVGISLSGVSIPAGQTANTYGLVLPTDLTGKELVIELEGEFGGRKVGGVALIDGSQFNNSRFESDNCYTLDMNICNDGFVIENIGIEGCDGGSEVFPSVPVR